MARGEGVNRKLMSRRSRQIDILFNPRSVAIVGASKDASKFGTKIINNLFYLGYEGSIFPVNPGASEIAGLKCYPQVSCIPQDVDLAVIVVPASRVPDVVRDCANKGVGGVVIISSGFAELGREEGIQRQREIVDIATKVGMRIVGPNTTGILDTSAKFTTTYIDLGEEVRGGPVAFIAQTGLFAGVMLKWLLTTENFGVSKVAGLGNKCDVAEYEILDYLAEDDDTKAIIVYLEGVKDGESFLNIGRRVASIKPVIMLKGGRTEEGGWATLSHTGSLAGSDEAFNAALRQTGIMLADDFQHLIDFAKMFAYQPLPQGNRVAIVSSSGGAGVLATDACVRAGLVPAKLSDRTLQRVQENMPDWARVRHPPLDIEALSERVGREEAYRISLDAALADEATDCCVVFIPMLFIGEKTTIDLLVQARNAYSQKPMAVCSIGDKATCDSFFQLAGKVNMPVFPSIERAVNGLAALYRYKRFREG